MLSDTKKEGNSCPWTRINRLNYVTISRTAVRLGCNFIGFLDSLRFAATKTLQLTVAVSVNAFFCFVYRWYPFLSPFTSCADLLSYSVIVGFAKNACAHSSPQKLLGLHFEGKDHKAIFVEERPVLRHLGRSVVTIIVFNEIFPPPVPDFLLHYCIPQFFFLPSPGWAVFNIHNYFNIRRDVTLCFLNRPSIFTSASFVLQKSNRTFQRSKEEHYFSPRPAEVYRPYNT